MHTHDSSVDAGRPVARDASVTRLDELVLFQSSLIVNMCMQWKRNGYKREASPKADLLF